MNASQLQGIEISNDPTTGLERKVYLKEFSLRPFENYIKTTFEVRYFVNGQDATSNRLPSYEKTLYASDNENVNPLTGELVGLDFEGGVGEYSFFLVYAENPIEIYSLIYSRAIEADQARRAFDI
jgi:hypothetical protein